MEVEELWLLCHVFGKRIRMANEKMVETRMRINEFKKLIGSTIDELRNGWENYMWLLGDDKNDRKHTIIEGIIKRQEETFNLLKERLELLKRLELEVKNE
jgi:hypothetical protein